MGGDGIQGFGGCRQADLADAQQEFAGLAYALLDVKGIIHPRVVDEALPAHRGAGLLEVDPHDQHQGVGDLIRQGLEALRVVESSHGVVDAAGSHHHHETRVLPGQDALEVPAPRRDGLGHFVRHWKGRVDLLG